MTEPGLLFDASSLIYALKLRCVEALHGGYVQHLTVYEALSAVWREARSAKGLRREEAERLAEVLAEVLSYLNVLSIRSCELEVLRAAIDLGLTVYDASYVILAERNGLTLVTEDEELRRKASRRVRVASLREVLEWRGLCSGKRAEGS